MGPFSITGNTDEKFKNLDLSGETLESLEFIGCEFQNCKLIESTLKSLRFEDCTFTHCDLSLVKLPGSQFKRVTFDTCRLMGVNWSAANWEKKSLLEYTHVSFKDCLLDHAIFIGLHLKSTAFTGCRAHSLDFEGANLTRANFHNTDLEGSRFVQCDLTEADFTGASNYQINASENTLHKTRFSLPEAIALLHGLDIILGD
ncbi:MAG: pentapeptide repeat-containing protein [Anaerolineaceae bacterium]|nr:pentapeptide repeat-containing protein [Anaerolineaceae bacterium]